jgi:peptide/nickel transport system permease protein
MSHPMGRYLAKRLAWTVLVIAIVTFVTFVIFYVLPSGDPALRFAGKQPTPQLLAQVRADLGLDHNVIVQYLLYLKRLVLGDKYGWPGLGYSYSTGAAIEPQLWQRALITMQLILGGAILWLAIGIPVGVMSAVRARSRFDRISLVTGLVFMSTPVFWLGLVLLWLFWTTLGWLPGTGYVAFTTSPASWAAHMVLPWITLALLFAAIYARVIRSNMIDTLGADYIRTARAKGLSERRVIGVHALRASLVPVITLLAIDIGTLIGGTVITETVFNLQGLGSWVLQGALNQDLPVTLAVTIVVTVVVTLLSLVADITYAYLDPRVRYK